MRKSGKICEHSWQPSAWDKRFEKCEWCPAVRLTAEEWNRRNEAGWAAADKRRAEYEATQRAKA